VEALYILTMGVFKIALGLFFIRVLPYPRQRQLVWITVSIFSLYSLGYFFFVIFQCGVPSGDRYWRRKLANQCDPRGSALGTAYAHAALSASTDLMFILLPISVVRNTRLSKKEKWIVAGIMSIGAVYVCLCNICH
jgi:hypothetical protein